MQNVGACRNNFLGGIGISTQKGADLHEELKKLMKRGGGQRIVQQWTHLRQTFQVWSGHPHFSSKDREVVELVHRELEKSKRQVTGMTLVLKDIEKIAGLEKSQDAQAALHHSSQGVAE